MTNNIFIDSKLHPGTYHGALIRVPGALVVIRVRNESGANPEDCVRFDLHVGSVWSDIFVRQSDKAIVQFVHVQIFDQTIVNEVIPRPIALR